MKPRYVLAPEAAEDLAAIWRYIKKRSNLEIADRVESEIRERILFLSQNPGAGHWRKDLTDLALRFFPIYSYLIAYRPETKPLQIVAILHGRREIDRVLTKRPL